MPVSLPVAERTGDSSSFAPAKRRPKAGIRNKSSTICPTACRGNAVENEIGAAFLCDNCIHEWICCVKTILWENVGFFFFFKIKKAVWNVAWSPGSMHACLAYLKLRLPSLVQHKLCVVPHTCFGRCRQEDQQFVFIWGCIRSLRPEWDSWESIALF